MSQCADVCCVMHSREMGNLNSNKTLFTMAYKKCHSKTQTQCEHEESMRHTDVFLICCKTMMQKGKLVRKVTMLRLSVYSEVIFI